MHSGQQSIIYWADNVIQAPFFFLLIWYSIADNAEKIKEVLNPFSSLIIVSLVDQSL
jgi:hypothetical protein